MKTIKIAAGTASEQKIDYLKEVLSDIGINAEVVSVDVESGVSDQPITEEETQIGSLNRARAAFENVEGVDFGIGIEVGYHKNKNEDFEMFCCTSIFGKGEAIASCSSTRFLLPDFHQQILKKNKHLGEYVRKYKEEIDEPVVNYIRELVRGRKPLIVEATRNALLNYLEIFSTVEHLLASGNLGYRKKASGIVTDRKGKYLIVQLVGYSEGHWNWPGGGVEEGEEVEDAILRELQEELGTDKFRIVGRSSIINKYDWPDHVIAKRFKAEGRTWKGQEVTHIRLEYLGDETDIKPDPGEIKQFKWVNYEELESHFVIPNQWVVAEKVIADLDSSS